MKEFQKLLLMENGSFQNVAKIVQILHTS
ncbi:hypothetical protein SEUBUCD646_0K01500 [Saccharomyces eubayanus]|nr:hypothetical protein SEUBUCD646_0K01500 [Saccharomyces eubayanus]